MTADSNSTPTKTCTKCGECKPLTDFYVRAACRMGRHSRCKKCLAQESKQWIASNPDRAKEIQRDFKRKMRETAEGRAKLSKINGEYSKRNRLTINEKLRMRRTSDPLFAMKTRYRSIVAKAVHRQGFTKRSIAQDLLGCSWVEFKAHIERQFLKGMTWDNRSAWELDHIVAISTALSDEDVVALSHFTNLRPLWIDLNRAKGAQITHLI